MYFWLPATRTSGVLRPRWLILGCPDFFRALRRPFRLTHLVSAKSVTPGRLLTLLFSSGPTSVSAARPASVSSPRQHACTTTSWHCKCASCRRARNSPAPAACAGTVTHMPPELLMDGILTKAADVYAFGVLLCECSHLPVPVQAPPPLLGLCVAGTLLAAHGRSLSRPSLGCGLRSASCMQHLPLSALMEACVLPARI